MINKSIVSAITLIGSAVGVVCYFYRRSRKICWKPIGTVGDLLIYPLKSGRRVSIKSAFCTQFGLEAGMLKDRCLVVYNEETKAFQTARNFPRLLLIETKTNKGGFTLISPGTVPLGITIPKLGNSREDYVVMWNGEKVFTIDCGDEAAEWISKTLLGYCYGLRLGYHDGSCKRDIRKFHSRYIEMYPKLKRATSGKYSDLSTILLLTDSSVNDVISRVTNVSKHNFRPNIVIGGANIEPYSEDNWDRIKVGDVVLKSVMPCPRCSITTIDPESGLHNEGFEPITTMKKYRKLTKYNSGLSYPNLGVYMSVEHPGRICVGDVVYIPDN
uniref:MOSC domain-containing protein n=3 Tax=Photinus pyralis TaxID=7054 RepID=A0A1Y1KBW2_PHOPY